MRVAFSASAIAESAIPAVDIEPTPTPSMKFGKSSLA